MSAIKRKIIPYFRTKKANVFTLFILIAIVFSLLTKLSRDYTHTFSFTINAVNVPEEMVVIKDSTNVMQITLTTYGFKHIKYYLSTPTIDVDFNNLDKTSSHYNWIEKKELTNVIKQFDANVKIESINPDTLKFRYDINSVKKVPLVLNSSIKFSSGFDLTESFKILPDSIKVIGPKILTDSISEIQTELLTLNNVNANINSKIKLMLPNQNQDLMSYSHESVEVSAVVEKFTEGTIDVPINVVNVPSSISVKFYPKVVPVIYYTSLSNFNNISSTSFIVECDYNAQNNQSTYLIPKIVQQPGLVKNVRLNVKRVEYIIVE